MSAEAHSPSPQISAQIRVTLLVGMCAVSLAGLDQTIVSTAQPTIVGELGGIDKVSWIFTAYMLTMAISTPVVAKLSDVYSRRRGEVLVTATPGIVKQADALAALGVDGVVVAAVTLAASTATGDVVAGMERYATRWS